MGAEVKWNNTTQTINVTRGSWIVTLRVGDDTATINGQKRNLEVPAKVVNGRTFAPTRFIVESFWGDPGYNHGRIP